jgi:hypothetical protein
MEETEKMKQIDSRIKKILEGEDIREILMEEENEFVTEHEMLTAGFKVVESTTDGAGIKTIRYRNPNIQWHEFIVRDNVPGIQIIKTAEVDLPESFSGMVPSVRAVFNTLKRWHFEEPHSGD